MLEKTLEQVEEDVANYGLSDDMYFSLFEEAKEKMEYYEGLLDFLSDMIPNLEDVIEQYQN